MLLIERNLKSIIHSILFMLFLGLVNNAIAQTKQSLKPNIKSFSLEKFIGTWAAVDDPNWKITFQAGNKCTHFYEKEVVEKDSFSITNAVSPENDSYLTTTNLSDKSQTRYILNGISGTSLSITDVESGTLYVFKKVK